MRYFITGATGFLGGVLARQLRQAGHEVEPVGAYENMMGHAGMLVLHPSGVIEMAGDPRSDGQAVGF